jgi:predicted DNA-binding ribbon-helix-helix protein
MKSSIVKHSVCIAGRRTSISLEDEFWGELRKIARNMSVSALIRDIQVNRQSGNLCSAIRLFVVGFYRDQPKTGFAYEDRAPAAEASGEPDRPPAYQAR